ncbi:hypothetical protein [Bacteroides faecalis]|uniref:hypothetical protein n=1 Tax=Bacteroides faecalis TaxID=2447885 RepID=UPI001358BE51|nr:hypothetical protein [Bacteroides faecalis]
MQHQVNPADMLVLPMDKSNPLPKRIPLRLRFKSIHIGSGLLTTMSFGRMNNRRTTFEPLGRKRFCRAKELRTGGTSNAADAFGRRA